MARTPRNLGLMDLRAHLDVLQSARRFRSAAGAGRLTSNELRRLGKGKSLPYIMRMLRGDEAMNPDVLDALHRVVGLEEAGAALDVWHGPPEAMRAYVGPAAATLLQMLRTLARSRAPRVEISHAGPAVALVGPDRGPTRLDLGPHRFDVQVRGFKTVSMLLIEHDVETGRWFSLQGLDVATVGGRALDGDTPFSTDDPIPLTMNIVGPSGFCEIFALVSPKPFGTGLLKLVPQATPSGLPAAVSHDALARYLAARFDEEPTLVAASFAYRV